MTTTSTTTERERLERELEKLRERQKRRRAAYQRGAEKESKIRAAIEQLKVTELLGIPAGVLLRFRQPAGSKHEHLNDVPGTLTEIRRTRATVDFGEHGTFTARLDNLLPVAERDNQGFAIAFGQGGGK